MTLIDFVGRLEKSKPKTYAKGPAFTGRCPSCPSDSQCVHLMVHESDGWLHVNCIKGCGEEEILRSMGLEMEDRRVEPREFSDDGRPPKPAGDEFLYLSTNGTPVIKKVKFYMWVEAKDGKPAYWKKTFAQQKYVNGAWEKGKEGLPPEKAKILYNWPDVVKALADRVEIFICEGEKACRRMKQMGLVATCQPEGAGNGEDTAARWMSFHTQALRKAAQVTIIADRDEVGEKYARYVAARLDAAGIPVRVVQSATTSPKDDAYDHFEAGKTVDEFAPRPDLLPVDEDDCTLVDIHAIEEPVFLWEPYLRRGQLNLMDAKGGAGKTTFCIAVAMQGSLGKLPCGHGSCDKFTTLYFGSEDSAGELRSVYVQMGGLPGHFYSCPTDKVATLRLDADGLAYVKKQIRKTGAKFVIFDAIIYFLPQTVKNPYNPMEIAPVLNALREVARETDCCILMIRHFAASGEGKDVENFGAGSQQWRNSCRSQLVLRPHPNLKEFPRYAIVQHTKGALQVAIGEPFAVQFIDGNLTWASNVDLGVFEKEYAKPGPKPKLPLREAVQWMIGYLKDGPKDSGETIAALIEFGGTKDSYYKAYRELGIKGRPITTQGVQGTQGFKIELPEEFDPFDERWAN